MFWKFDSKEVFRNVSRASVVSQDVFTGDDQEIPIEPVMCSNLGFSDVSSNDAGITSRVGE